MTSNQPTDNIDTDEDIAEIILDHFPNASRKVCEEMLKDINKLIDEQVKIAEKITYDIAYKSAINDLTMEGLDNE